MIERERAYDIVIIGSGAGGGTVAKELAPLCASGVKIALIEWGGFFAPADNLRLEVEMAKRFYFDSGGFQTRSQDMTLAFAKSVGGSTSVYTGTSLQMEADVFNEWRLPDFAFADLAPRYEKYVRENNVHYLKDDEVNDNNRLFKTGCEKLGWKVDSFPLNLRNCKGLGTCNMGCAQGAKQGTGQVQIPAAQKLGVEVIHFCRVERIDGEKLFVEVHHPKFGLAPSPWPAGKSVIRAKKIVIAGGSVQTAALLFRSFGDSLSPALGRYFTCHPALIVAGKQPRPIQNTEGHPKSLYCEEFLHSHKVLLETCMYFPFTFAKSINGYGTKVDDFLADYRRLQMILILALDEARAENRIRINSKGEPIVEYKMEPYLIENFAAGLRKSAEILFAAGVTDVHSPIGSQFLIRADERDRLEELIQAKHYKSGQVSISAAHLMGGARMGSDPKSAVVDSFGRVFGKKNLYVADSSLFPGSVGVNPYLTIMAFADRVAETIRKDLGGRA